MTPDQDTAMRSLLFVPGDSERKLSKADGVAADVIILDLEDAVAPDRKAGARGMVREYLTARPERPRQQLWVRINAVDQADAGADLGAVMPARPDGIVLPKTRSPDDVELLGRRIGAYEAEYEIAVGSTRILPVATETPQALFTLGEYARCGKRLAGMTWGAEDLAAADRTVAGRRRTSGSAACACLPRMPPASRPSIPCSRTSVTPRGSAPPATRPAGTVSAASWPSTPTRWRSSINPSRRAPTKSSAHRGSSSCSRPIRARARWPSMA
jgi:hypothetical protein